MPQTDNEIVKGELLFDGNEKQVYATEDPEKVIFRFKDVATAYNNIKKAVFPGKGVVSNRISSSGCATISQAPFRAGWA